MLHLSYRFSLRCVPIILWFITILNPQAAARARPSQSRAVIDGFGLAWRFWKLKPLKARPKPWLSGQAGPEHHYESDATMQSPFRDSPYCLRVVRCIRLSRHQENFSGTWLPLLHLAMFKVNKGNKAAFCTWNALENLILKVQFRSFMWFQGLSHSSSTE